MVQKSNYLVANHELTAIDWATWQAKRSYGEACRFAHALDLVGERWALLVVRELLLGPKRFTDLRRGLPNASSNILAERLRELEDGGVVRHRKLPPPAAASVYELTEWGRELEPIVTRLGAWGARSPVAAGAGQIGPDSIVLALRSLFDPEAAAGLTAAYELRLGEADVFRVELAGGELDLGRGPAEDPDGAIATDPGTLAALLTGQLPLDDALDSGLATIEGSKRAVNRFLRLFPMPEPCRCDGVGEALAVAGRQWLARPAIDPAQRPRRPKLWPAGATARSSATARARSVESLSSGGDLFPLSGGMTRHRAFRLGGCARARDLGDEDVDDAFAALEAAAGADQGRGADHGPVALVDGRRDDQVDGAALVLEQHEDDPLGGLGTLAGDDHAGHLDLAAVVDRGRGRCCAAAPGSRSSRISPIGCSPRVIPVER